MKKLIITILFPLFLFSTEKTYETNVKCELVKVYDGDTIFCNIPSFPKIIGENISVRISNIDTPELKSKNENEKQLAKNVKKELTLLLKSAKVIWLKKMKRDKYFRINSEIFADDISVENYLIDKGLARKYDGGTKQKW
jgi:endonuclease YncB( thermonuclease family)